ncbi:uncharacterized protein PFB0765w-like [Apis mellifera]|uniref:Uncharacterized protein PFB0765w-like n=1 Tax=Apis mellifera TaxID=7460 RepID=A0A7M7L1U4_APIME|nr:uncharacterized protein PFB0765w-like [Apis mellifera]|eukprot:XP_026295429.1 uncharacterized protein PFB0765w-like [Apis mellifera]
MQEEDNHRLESRNIKNNPEKLQRTPRVSEFDKKDIMSQEVKHKIHYTPQNSPNKYSKTPQSNESFKKDAKSQSESNKRKIQSFHNENLEKIQKICPSGKFVNTLIGQWSKHMGIQTPLSETGTARENLIMEEMKQVHVIEERKIQKLQKKLQIAEETISSLSTSHEMELRAKEEILQQLNSDWESITKYYYEISESLKGFQQHKDNLSKLYNEIIVIQQSTMKKLQQELCIMKLKDDEQKNIISTMENKIINQERRIHEMTSIENELKKQFEELKNNSVLEKNHLHNVYTEEKLELIKKQENLTSMNQELQVQLQKITEEKQNLTILFAEKDDEIIKLQGEIVTCKNKIENLLCHNTELSAKYEKSINKEEKLSKEIQTKAQEIDKLRENLNTRQEIESSLAKDFDMIDNKYKNMQNDFLNIENKLKETQVRNINLEQSLQKVNFDNEHKIMELCGKIEFLEKEKAQILLEKHLKIQELENTHKLSKEKHETEIKSLKQEFDVKLIEMKKTLAIQNSEFLKLNETINKINNEENQNRQINFHDQYTKINHNELQDNLKEKIPLIESNPIEIIKKIEKTNQVCEMKEFQNQENVNKSKIIIKNKNEISNLEQDIYSFNIREINDELQNSKDDFLPKKKIFKTRSYGLRQYGTSKKHQFGTLGKISKK